jgi:CheY-like chemotaxis protein
MILFIDDEPLFNQSYVDALIDANYNVHFERDINKAIELFRKRKNEIQLVIIDVMMDIPEILPKDFNVKNAESGLKTGVEILRLLSEIPNSKYIPKIFLTNVADEKFLTTYANSSELK